MQACEQGRHHWVFNSRNVHVFADAIAALLLQYDGCKCGCCQQWGVLICYFQAACRRISCCGGFSALFSTAQFIATVSEGHIPNCMDWRGRD